MGLTRGVHAVSGRLHTLTMSRVWRLGFEVETRFACGIAIPGHSAALTRHQPSHMSSSRPHAEKSLPVTARSLCQPVTRSMTPALCCPVKHSRFLLPDQ